MKKLTLKATVALMLGAMAVQSCVGSFSLFNKYAAWQKDMTSNKFVNAIVGFVLMPFVVPVTIVIDAVVLNTIEFWDGDNPIQANTGKTQQVMGQDGLLYAVTTLRNGYEIKSPTGELTLLTYDKKQRAWAASRNGVVRELFRFNPDGTVRVVMPDGTQRDLTLDAQGVFEARMAVGDGHYFAQR